MWVEILERNYYIIMLEKTSCHNKFKNYLKAITKQMFGFTNCLQLVNDIKMKDLGASPINFCDFSLK